ncbi:MAG: response regulator [Limnothrix sp. RL_2_0]|nr:response regulator [Limnothrix sp. RL_2_0]
MLSSFEFDQRGDILIVDDVPENLQLLFEILSDEGHEVRRVLNGSQALKVIEIDPPDLILLDIKMPAMDGYEVCKRLKSDPKTASIPIIFLSALNEILDKVKAFSVGGSDYINKPFDVYEVLMRVNNQLKLLRTNQAIENQNSELRTLNKDLESFNYMVSHDLRRPLTRLLGCSELLCDSQLSEAELQEIIEIIVGAGREMNQIITDLMHLAMIRKEKLNLESVNLSEMVAGLFQSLQRKEPDRAVEIFVEADLEVIGDRQLLKLALENLVDNAWKYTCKTSAPRIEFIQADDDSYCLRDNGAGFKFRCQEDVFAPFQRFHTEKEFKGTGIGLAIVHRIIESHQGAIWCEAAVNEGAAFHFTLGV